MKLFFRSFLIAFGMLISSLSYTQSTIVELDGSQGGLLINRLTNLERNALTTPPNGLMIFNMDSGCINYHFNNDWSEVCGNIISTCSDDGDCPTGQICVNGECEDDPSSTPCETDEQCPTGWFCFNGFCTQQP